MLTTDLARRPRSVIAKSVYPHAVYGTTCLLVLIQVLTQPCFPRISRESEKITLTDTF